MDIPEADSNLTVDITEEFEMNEARGIFCPNWLIMIFVVNWQNDTKYFKNINLCEKVEIAKKDLNTIFNKINKSLSDLEAVGHSQTEEIPNRETNFKEKTEVSFEVNKNMKLQRDDIEDSRQSLQFSSSSHSNVQ